MVIQQCIHLPIHNSPWKHPFLKTKEMELNGGLNAEARASGACVRARTCVHASVRVCALACVRVHARMRVRVGVDTGMGVRVAHHYLGTLFLKEETDRVNRTSPACSV